MHRSGCRGQHRRGGLWGVSGEGGERPGRTVVWVGVVVVLVASESGRAGVGRSDLGVVVVVLADRLWVGMAGRAGHVKRASAVVVAKNERKCVASDGVGSECRVKFHRALCNH